MSTTPTLSIRVKDSIILMKKEKVFAKRLLKYPIEFTRISSRYNLNRFHPVQKRFKAHLGTDFAAPTGTPIRSVGDGLIEEAQYKSNNGNYVKIRHNGTYTTQYLHMSRIAQGVRAGTRVKQGQVIGYVGSTGLGNRPTFMLSLLEKWYAGRRVARRVTSLSTYKTRQAGRV